MTDLDDLRDAMHTTPGFEPRPLDLALVMAAGGRLRRRRRLAVGATSGLAVLVLLVGGAQFLPSAQAPQATVPAAPPAAAQPSAPASDPPALNADGEVLGKVVGTGLRVDGAQRALWMVALGPDVPFGLVCGRRLADGSLQPDVLANEVEGSVRSDGFHAAQAAMVVDGGTTLAFGYYAGPATRITVKAAGRPVSAKLARWSEDPSIVLFWFTPDQVRPGVELSALTAYDVDGRKLPGGNASFAVG